MVAYTNLPFDVLHQICLVAQESRLERKEWEEREDKDQLSPYSLINLSMVDRRTRDVAVPIIFQSGVIKLKHAWLKTTEDEVNALIDAIMQNSQILRIIKQLVISIYFYQYKVNYVPAKFGDLLFRLPNLERFTLDVQHAHANDLLAKLQSIVDSNQVIQHTDAEKSNEKDVKVDSTEASKTIRIAATAKIGTLSSVRALTIQDERFQFVTQLCPNLEDLTVSSRSAWRFSSRDDEEPSTILDIKTLGMTHSHLRRLHFSDICEGYVLVELAQHLPHLEDLGFIGGYSRGADEDCVVNHIPHLKLLKNLKHLTLPGLLYLGLGYDAPWCGNAYFNNPGLVDKVERDRKDAQERLVKALEGFLETSPSSTTIPGNFDDFDSVEASDKPPSSSTTAMLQDVSVGSSGYYTVFKVLKNRTLKEASSN